MSWPKPEPGLVIPLSAADSIPSALRGCGRVFLHLIRRPRNPVTEIVPASGFYDYEAKYAHGGSKHVLPARLPPDVTARALSQAALAHAALGCRGVTRSDFRYDPQTGAFALLEVNTQPGMTPTSLVPEQAAHMGIAFEDLVAWMVEDAGVGR